MLNNTKPYIADVTGTTITDEEKALFSEHPPLGFILFARNIETPDQLKSLCQDMRECAGWHCPILIDQEGGRVARMRPPHWRDAKAAAAYAALASNDLEKAKKAAYLNARLMGQELLEHGINVDCAPMLDLLYETSDNIIGDRAFGSDPTTVIALGEHMARGLKDSGVLPIMKHIPGHGRATLDSHEALPVIDASLDEMRTTDFIPFKELGWVPWAMTAHIVYSAIDTKNPATLSGDVINVIRADIGYEGLIITDDLSMKALDGSYTEKVQRAVTAGCDIMLVCNATLAERRETAEATPETSKALAKRLEASLNTVPKAPDTLAANAEDELATLLAA